jgi:anti-sigma regulatory factor (Ser/Thr protein kinase)
LNEVSEKFTVQGGDFASVGKASTAMKSALEMIGIPSAITRRVSIIAYEAEMNLVIHAGGGIIQYSVFPDRIEITAEDNGPGIENIELAMEEGYSTASDEIRELGFGAGMGLSNIKRNSDDLKIDSIPEEGTSLVAVVLLES